MTTLESFSGLSDSELLAEVKAAAEGERHATARLVALLAHVDARRLYLGEGCSSLFTCCTQVLRHPDAADGIANRNREAVTRHGEFDPTSITWDLHARSVEVRELKRLTDRDTTVGIETDGPDIEQPTLPGNEVDQPFVARPPRLVDPDSTISRPIDSPCSAEPLPEGVPSHNVRQGGSRVSMVSVGYHF